jgi:hypothetical protein
MTLLARNGRRCAHLLFKYQGNSKINAIEIFNTNIIEGNSEQQKLCILTGGIKTPYFYRINIKRNVKI